MFGRRWPLILSARDVMSTSQRSPMCVWLMSKVDWKCDMQVLSISHQSVWRTVTCSLCSARDAMPMPVNSDRWSTGGVCFMIRCSKSKVLGWSAIGVAAGSVLCCPYCLFLPWPLWPLYVLLCLPLFLPLPLSAWYWM